MIFRTILIEIVVLRASIWFIKIYKRSWVKWLILIKILVIIGLLRFINVLLVIIIKVEAIVWMLLVIIIVMMILLIVRVLNWRWVNIRIGVWIDWRKCITRVEKLMFINKIRLLLVFGLFIVHWKVRVSQIEFTLIILNGIFGWVIESSQ